MKKEEISVPANAIILVRNLARRRELLARLSKRPLNDIPIIKIKDTLLKFFYRISLAVG